MVALCDCAGCGADHGAAHASTKYFSRDEMKLVKSVDDFAKHGYRTLAFATRKLNSPEVDGVYTQEEIESQL